MTIKESFPYNAEGYLDSEHVEDLLRLVHDNIPKSGKEGVIIMTYDSEYDGLEVRVFKK